MGDIVAYASGIYSTEIDTSLLVEALFLYTTNTDPWTQSSTTCLLFEFGRYWNDNRTGVDRTLAHYMSGKNNGGGVAWTGVLCNDGFNWPGGVSSGCPGLTPDTDNYGGDYGYTGDMDGNFDINNPSVLWDIVAVSHEIGHNFDSPHTHCYSGIGGSAEQVDECFAGHCGGTGCYCGGTSLPGPQGAGSGTIMSYCHFLSGGMSNISLTFGEGHPHGFAPERVGAQMSSHVVSAASGNPSCLAFTNVTSVFEDNFEGGDFMQWNIAVP